MSRSSSRFPEAFNQQRDWHSHPVEHVAEVLQTRLDRGLAASEANQRLKIFGPNELTEARKPGFWRHLLGQFNNSIVLTLIVAALVSLLLGDTLESVAILAIVVLNATLGVVQESKAEEALAALKKMASPEAHVLRDGERVSVPARELVPGDIILLEAGNFVPADVRLVQSVNLKIDESSLTGESAPVDKRADTILQREIPLGDRRNTAYMSTLVAYGRGKGVVINTGMETEIGLIAQMIQSYQTEPTPLQQKLQALGRTLAIATVGICALVFVIAVLHVGNADPTVLTRQGLGAFVHVYQRQLVEAFLIAVSLAIAAVPEGLAAIVTVCLALGMREMIRRHALIRRLPAVETLGSATAICSDKTGTLTQNEMTVTRLWVDGRTVEVTGEGYHVLGEFRVDGQPVEPCRNLPAAELLLRILALANDAVLQVSGEADGSPSYRIIGDPTEGALVVAAAKAGLKRDDLNQRYLRLTEVPFESARKMMSTIHEIHDYGLPGISQEVYDLTLRTSDVGDFVVFTKGGPDVVLERCTHILHKGHIVPLSDELRRSVREQNTAMARQALRLLGAAFKPLDALPAKVISDGIENGLIFVGLAGMHDPARQEVKPAVATARAAGIRTAMITGDHLDTARAVAEEIGLLRLNGRVISGAELESMSDADLAAQIDTIDVYARVSPSHKVRIVEAFLKRGHVVAMTGDGVNDAPALKRANIGIAMGITGTDVSKETADMVLTDDNYASIVAAVEEGRVIYSNIRKFVYYLLSCNVAEIAIILVATLLGLPSPLTPIQLLWLNLLTDGAPALALGLEKGDPDIMERPPRPVNEPVINRRMLSSIAIITTCLAAVVLIAYFTGLQTSPALAETMAFITLAFAELPIAYSARSEYFPLLRLGVFRNGAMQAAVGLSLILVLAVLYVPFLNVPFNTIPLGWQQWKVILPLIFVPAAVNEVIKALLYGMRPKKAEV